MRGSGMDGSVAVVTGAAGGIGGAVVNALAAEGAVLAAVDTDAGGLGELVTELRWKGTTAAGHAVDVADGDAVERVVEKVEGELGPIEMLVNVAGVLRSGPVVGLPDEDWAAAFAVNTLGVFHVSRAVARRMVPRSGGSIVTVGSNAAAVPRMGMAAYAASKAAAAQFTRCLGLELAAHGIRCNVVSPGSADTSMQRALWGDHGGRAAIAGDPAAFRTGIPLGRLAAPEDVADAVVFLLSARARHITMHDLYVDGGASLRAWPERTNRVTTEATAIAAVPECPLDDYRPGSFYYSSTRGALLTRVARSPQCHPRPARPGLVVGAIPFRPELPIRLTIPNTVRWGPPPSPPAAPAAAETASETYDMRAVPEPAEYAGGVARALDLLGTGGLEKVVLARSLQLTAPGPIDPAGILRGLVAANPHAHVFAVPLPGAATLVGASPELLVSRRGRSVYSHPLAGSAARSADPVEDERRAAALLASGKNRDEHDVVVAAVAETLRLYCADLEVPDRPSLVATPTMWHLGTRMRGRLRDPGVTAVTLALALHPTPAVCGTPTSRAREIIAELESFDRGHYAGAVGWCDAAGDGEFAVAIRCAEIDGDRMRLFAGAGIVAGSEPDAELAETTAKFQTLLRALGRA